MSVLNVRLYLKSIMLMLCKSHGKCVQASAMFACVRVCVCICNFCSATLLFTSVCLFVTLSSFVVGFLLL